MNAMNDLLVFLFGAVVLVFGIAMLYDVESFKNRALQRRRIRRDDLRWTARRLAKYILWAWLAFTLIFVSSSLLEAEPKMASLPFTLFLCFAGPLISTVVVFGSYRLLLRRLPVVDGDDNEPK